MTELATINKLKQAQMMIHEVREIDEIKRLIDQSEALKSYAKAQHLSKEVQQDIAEYNLYATRQMGMISRNIEKTKVNQYSKVELPHSGNSKIETLNSAGIDIRRANEAEKLAEIPEEEFIELIDEKKQKDDLTKNSVIKEAKERKKKQYRAEKISNQTKTEQTSESVDIYTTEKRYRIVYADPPWSYNDKQDTSKLGGAVKHYPTMVLSEICGMPVKNICEKDAVLFLWVTSPLLEECFEVIKAWGFKYKSSFIWDKVRHCMGHYNSVRHEFLLICTRGSCTPDNAKLYDSVQSIERGEHSEKPKEFIEMIDDLYKYGNRIELFCRTPNTGWDAFGNMI